MWAVLGAWEQTCHLTADHIQGPAMMMSYWEVAVGYWKV
jgi:hypothetical protein